MGILRNLITRVKEKFFKEGPEKLSENSVPLFRYDKMTVDNELGSNPELAKMVERGEQRSPGFERLLEDFFGALYKENPVVLPEESIAEKYRANRKHISDLMESEDFGKLRERTKLNKANSIAIAKELAEKVLALAPEEAEARQEVERREKQLQQLLDAAEMAELEGMSEAEQAEAAQEIEQAERALDRANEYMERTNRFAGRLTAAIEEKAAETADRLEQLMSMLHNFGYSKEQLERLSADTMLEMLHEIMHQGELKRMAELIGRFRRIARKLMRKSKEKENFTISGVTLGDNIADMVPQEGAFLLHPALRPNFLQRWMDEELEVWEREDVVETGKGPIVVCVDVSGSMEGAKDAYAKALLMAYLEIAKKEHRDLSVLFFDGYLRQEYTLKRGQVRPDKLIEILTYFSGGGTNFMTPLDRAMEIIGKHQAMRQADILLITDGQAAVEDHFQKRLNKERDRLGFRLISAFVENEVTYYRETALTLLNSLSDAVFDVNDLTDENAEAIIAKMLED